MKGSVMSDRIKPHFRKKMPENAIEFFSRDSDDKFKAEHPGAYRILKLAGFAAILLPLIIYVILTTIFFQQGNGWILLGLVGSMAIGVGLFNIVAAWIDQYLGHMLTILSLGIGAAFVAISCLLLS
jgi:hypothetical protein